MTAAELDEAYTKLCHGLTAVGEEKTPQALARLVLLLMTQAPQAAAVEQAIDDALDGLLPTGDAEPRSAR